MSTTELALLVKAYVAGNPGLSHRSAYHLAQRDHPALFRDPDTGQSPQEQEDVRHATVTGLATTIYQPAQTHTSFKPGVRVAIKMSNDERSLATLGLPKDAAFLAQSLRQHLGIRSNQ